MNATDALLAAGEDEFGAEAFGAVTFDAPFEGATPAPPPLLLSSVELQLDKPSALIPARTARVSTMRPGVQKAFPGFMSSLGFADEAMCLKSLTELMLGCFCDPKCRDARYVAAYDCILTGHKRSARAQFHEYHITFTRQHANRGLDDFF